MTEGDTCGQATLTWVVYKRPTNGSWRVFSGFLSISAAVLSAFKFISVIQCELFKYTVLLSVENVYIHTDLLIKPFLLSSEKNDGM